MDIKKYEELKNSKVIEDIKKDFYDYSDKMEGKVSVFELPSEPMIGVMVIFLAYLKMENTEIAEVTILEELKSQAKRLQEQHFQLIDNIAEKYTLEDMIGYILSENGERRVKKTGFSKTPDSIVKIADEILKVQKDEKVFDMCSGFSNFLTRTYLLEPKAIYSGIEINYMLNAISEIKNYVLKANWNLELKSVFEMNLGNKYDKEFSNYPFALRNYLTEEQLQKIASITKLEPKFIKRCSSDWIFNILLVEQLKETGKAVAIMTNGSFWRESDKEVRKWFVDNGYIETMISLPAHMFEFTTIPVTLIVLSHNNKEIRMVNAETYGRKERGNCILSDKEIKEIVENISMENDNSVSATISAIADTNYNLSPYIYMDALKNIENGIRLEELTLNIKRGLQIRKSDFDEFKTTKDTNCHYLTLSEIEDGYINVVGNNLKEIKEEQEKYLIKNDDVVLSKTASPFLKSAIVEVDEGDKIIATGNIYIIEFDKTKVNPQYIQAFFMSDIGKMSIKSISGGGTLPIIAISQLKNLIIPVPDMEIQNKIADEYMATIYDIRRLKRKYEIRKSSLSHIYEGGNHA